MKEYVVVCHNKRGNLFMPWAALLTAQSVFLALQAVNSVDKNVGRVDLGGKMTDVAMVVVVIKSSKKLPSEERGRHKKRAGEIWRSVSLPKVYVFVFVFLLFL